MLKFYKSKYIIATGEKVFENCALAVKDGLIVDIINNSKIPENSEIIDYKNDVITSGFINLHTHLQYTDLKPVFNQKNLLKSANNNKNIDFSGWIINLIKEYHLWDEKKKIKSFTNGLKEAILSGCTSIVQLSAEDCFFDILNNLDLKSFIFLETFSNSEQSSKQEIKKIINRINNIKTNCTDNLTVGISPHSIYNVHKALWEEIANFSVEDDILIHTHLAESIDEINWLNNIPSGIDKLHQAVKWNNIKPCQSGLNPVEYLEKLGVLAKLKENFTAAHCIELDEKSLEKLVHYGAKIAHCPRSNVLLHGKTLNFKNLPEILLKNTGIGTDSRFSNIDLSILNEAKFAKDYTGLDFKNLMDMLTINSARILKIDNRTGSLEKGKDADFLVFKQTDKTSCFDILSKSKPDDIYIKGNKIVQNGEFISKYRGIFNEPEQYPNF